MPNDSFTTPGGTPLNAFFIEPRGRKGSVWQLETALDTGVRNLAAHGLRRGQQSGTSSGQCSYCTSSGSCPSGSGTAIPPLTPTQIAQENAARTALQSAGCFGCHGSGSGGLTMTSANFPARTMGLTSSTNSAKLLIWPGDATRSYLFEKISSATDPLPDGSPRMPPFGSPMPMSGINAVRDWINGLTPAAGCGSCPTSGCETDFVDGNDAFAFLTASRLVESSWSEVMGQPLTIANHFPRNLGQRDILWNITELHFVRSHWSMEHLLSRMMTSEFFNRLPPATTTGPSAYELPNYLDPWSASDPRVPPVALPGTPPGSGMAPTPDPAYDKDDEANRLHEYNSMTDGVHRYSPRSLLYSVHAALGWPAPPRAASGSYPDDTLRKSLGQFYRDAEPGFREIGFQGLLQWEGSHGTCDKPANHTGDDWIDKLAQAVTAFNASNTGSPIKVRDVVLALKDRIIVDPSIQTSTPTDAPSSETAALQALFGGALNSHRRCIDCRGDRRIDRKDAQLLWRAARDAALLPGRHRARAARREAAALGVPRRRAVRLPGGLRELHRRLARARQTAHLHRQQRGTRGPAAVPVPAGDRFLPQGFCTALPFEVRNLDECLKSPRLCLPEPPPCDPRCARIDCCGGPLPPISGSRTVRDLGRRHQGA